MKKCWQINTLAGDKHNTSTRSHTGDQDEDCLATKKVTIKLVYDQSFKITQQQLSPLSVESWEIMIDNFV